MHFKKEQTLNDWADMLDAIYGKSQNYSKTPYEVHAHLTEVCGIFAKYLFKKRDKEAAKEFLPKMFAWSVALMRKVNPQNADIEAIIFRKYPGVCPYCLRSPCTCWSGEKPTFQEESLRNAYFQNKARMGTSLNDYQLMFREIYEESWKTQEGEYLYQGDIWRNLFLRLVEELAEVGEALRFHHLYPENFENELADLLAWWFALVSTVEPNDENEKAVLAEDLLWAAYPGTCPNCQMIPCLCRAGPVRQLMSQPIPGHDHRFDGLTSLFNQAACKQDIEAIESGEMVIPFPSACARLDVDDFKEVNDSKGHPAGDEALRQIASVIRQAVRERDRVYRVGGDEFAILFTNYTEEEASGAMRRVCDGLTKKEVRWVSQEGEPNVFSVSLSIGVSEFFAASDISSAFERADSAAYKSKELGKGTVTRSSDI